MLSLTVTYGKPNEGVNPSALLLFLKLGLGNRITHMISEHCWVAFSMGCEVIVKVDVTCQQSGEIGARKGFVVVHVQATCFLKS